MIITTTVFVRCCCSTLVSSKQKKKYPTYLHTCNKKKERRKEKLLPKEVMNLVLDLDETLLHSIHPRNITTGKLPPADATFTLSNGEVYATYGRPGLSVFFDFAYRRFRRIIVWTAADTEYARRIVNLVIIPAAGGRKPDLVWTRADCEQNKEGYYYKPLDKLFHSKFGLESGLTFSNTFIIEDRCMSAYENLANLVLVPKFNVYTHLMARTSGREGDRWLNRLITTLSQILASKIDAQCVGDMRLLWWMVSGTKNNNNNNNDDKTEISSPSSSLLSM